MNNKKQSLVIENEKIKKEVNDQNNKLLKTKKQKKATKKILKLKKLSNSMDI